MDKFLRALLLAGIVGWGGLAAAEDAKADKDAKEAKDAKDAGAEEITDETQVTILGKNKVFHLPDCKEVKKAEKNGKDMKQMTMGEAKKEKMHPCPQCVGKALKKQEKKAKEEAKAAKKHKKEEENKEKDKDEDKDKDKKEAN